VRQVAFHDTSRMRKRIPLLNDFFGFTAASLGDKVGSSSSSSSCA
jgi:chromosome transmission fidelity protein 4